MSRLLLPFAFIIGSSGQDTCLKGSCPNAKVALPVVEYMQDHIAHATNIKDETSFLQSEQVLKVRQTKSAPSKTLAQSAVAGNEEDAVEAVRKTIASLKEGMMRALMSNKVDVGSGPGLSPNPNFERMDLNHALEQDVQALEADLERVTALAAETSPKEQKKLEADEHTLAEHEAAYMPIQRVAGSAETLRRRAEGQALKHEVQGYLEDIDTQIKMVKEGLGTRGTLPLLEDARRDALKLLEEAEEMLTA